MTQVDIDNMNGFIEERYYFEFVLDDIPIRDFVGHMEEELFAFPHHHRISLFTHMHFKIEYNDDKIIAASVSTKGHTPLSLEDAVAPLDVTYTYSVKWQRTDAKYEDKGRRLRTEAFFPRTLEIHWLSVINSMVLVFLLIGFVVVILMRILGNDFARYNVRGDSDMTDGNEYGWKIIHTDVFRFPARTMLLCSILGVGSQFLAMSFGIIGMALLGLFNVHRHGAVNAAACVLYAVTCGIAGFVSARMYRQLGGKTWVRSVNLTSCLFSVPLFVVWSVQNSVAWAYNSTQALPFMTVLLLAVVWFTVGYPLTIVGGILGKNYGGNFVPPCRPKLAAREIPHVPWYKSTLAHCAVGGFLPFSAVSVELYYIFATLWGRERYTLYGILLVVFIILLSVTACVSVALTYFQLAAEDHRWWWRSVTSAGSTALFVLVYAIFYYTRRSNMSGLLQCVEFFSWTLLMCYVFFLALSTIAFFASFTFVCYIYSILKMD